MLFKIETTLRCDSLTTYIHDFLISKIAKHFKAPKKLWQREKIHLCKEELLYLQCLEKGSISDHMLDCDCVVLKGTIQEITFFEAWALVVTL